VLTVCLQWYQLAHTCASPPSWGCARKASGRAGSAQMTTARLVRLASRHQRRALHQLPTAHVGFAWITCCEQLCVGLALSRCTSKAACRPLQLMQVLAGEWIACVQGLPKHHTPQFIRAACRSVARILCSCCQQRHHHICAPLPAKVVLPRRSAPRRVRSEQPSATCKRSDYPPMPKWAVDS
jgi:hypothetical protein